MGLGLFRRGLERLCPSKRAAAAALFAVAALGAGALASYGATGQGPLGLRPGPAKLAGYSAAAAEVQVRPVVSSGPGTCSAASSGADPATTATATLPSFLGARHGCYSLGAAQFDTLAPTGVMEQWSPQGEVVDLGLSNADGAALGAAASADAGEQTAVVMFGQVLDTQALASGGDLHTIEVHLDGPPQQVADLAQDIKAAFEAYGAGTTAAPGPGGAPVAAAAFGLALLMVGASRRRGPRRPRAGARVRAARSACTQDVRRPAGRPHRRPWAILATCATAAGLLGPVAGAGLASLRPLPASASVTPSTAGDLYTVAGPGPTGWWGDSNPATTAFLDGPGQVAFDPNGDMYIADTANNRVQEVPASSGTQWGQPMTVDDVYTVAGAASGVSGYSANGAKETASFLDRPDGVALDSSGDLYVSNYAGNTVQEIAATSHTQWGIAMTQGDVYTLAGSAAGTSGASANGAVAGSSSALVSGPAMLSFDASGDLYIADSANNRVVEVAASAPDQWGVASMAANSLYTVAGSAGGTPGVATNGVPATSADLDGPTDAAVGPDGNLYVADSANNRVQVVPASSGTYWWRSSSVTADDIYTMAGSSAGAAGTGANGSAATAAGLRWPTSVAFPTSGNAGLYVADYSNSRAVFVPSVSGSYWGQAMTLDDIYTVAGSATGSWGYGGNGGPATSATLAGAQGVATTSSGVLYISDYGNDRVAAVPSAASNYWGQAMGADDIYNVAGPGSAETYGDLGQASDAGMAGASGVAEDASGDIYFSDQPDNRVQEIAATNHSQWGISMTAGDVYTVAGSPSGKGGSSPNGTSAASSLLSFPSGLAVDPAGDLYIANDWGMDVVEVSATAHTQWPSGQAMSMNANDVYTIAGQPGASGSANDNGPATSSYLSYPVAVAVDSAGNVWLLGGSFVVSGLALRTYQRASPHQRIVLP
jgi:hypothetical protein